MASRKLVVEVIGDTRNLDRNMRKSEQTMSRFGKTSSKSAGLIGGSFKKAAVAGAGLAAAYIGISKAKGAITTTEDLAKTTLTLHRSFGLAVESASEWAAQAKSRGAEGKQLIIGFKTLATQTQMAAKGTGASADQFKKLGITQKELKAHGDDLNWTLHAVSDGLGKLPAGTNKAALQAKLFGRTWTSVSPLVRDGAKAMDEQLNIAKKYGATFGGHSIKSMEDFIAAQRNAKLASLGLSVTFGTTVVPTLTKMIGGFAELVAGIREGKGIFGDFGDAVKATFSAIKTELGASLGKEFDGIKAAVTAVTGAFGKLPKAIKTTTAAAVALGAIAVFLPGGQFLVGAALVAAAAAEIIKHWGQIAPVLDRVKAAIVDKLGAAFAFVKKSLGLSNRDLTTFGHALVNAGKIVLGFGKVVGGLALVFGKMIVLPVIKKQLAGLLQVVRGGLQIIGGVVKVFSGIFTLNFGQAWKGVKQIFGGSINVVIGMLKGATAPIRGVTGAIGGVISGAFSAAFTAARHAVATGVKFILGSISTILGGFSSILHAASFIPGVGGQFEKASKGIDSVRRGLDGVVNKLDGVKKKSKVDIRVRLIDQATGSVQSIIGILDRLNSTSPSNKNHGRKGGVFGGGGLVDVLLSPGEMGVLPGGGAFMVPGARTAADTVPMSLPPRTSIFTDSGQGMLAAGATMSQALAQQAPHFREGGWVRTGFTVDRGSDPKQTYAGGMSFAELLVAGQNAGKHPNLSELLGIKQVSQYGMGNAFYGEKPPGHVLVRADAKHKAYNIIKSDVGSGQGGDNRYTIDLHGAIADKIAKGGKGFVEVARVGTPNSAGVSGGGGKQGTVGYTKITQPSISHPLLANLLNPPDDTSYADGLASGMSHGSRTPLLTSVLEGIAPDSANYPSRERVSGTAASKAKSGKQGAPGGPSGVTTYKGIVMAKWVAAALMWAHSKHGFNGQPTSGYRPGRDPHTKSGRSEHQGTRYPHGAVDFGGYNSGLATKLAAVRGTADYRFPLLAPIGFHDDGHASGIGHRRGGVVGMAAGYGAADHSPSSHTRRTSFERFNNWSERHSDYAKDFQGERSKFRNRGIFNAILGEYRQLKRPKGRGKAPALNDWPAVDRWAKKWIRGDRYRTGGLVAMSDGGYLGSNAHYYGYHPYKKRKHAKASAHSLTWLTRQLAGSPGQAGAEADEIAYSRRVTTASQAQLLRQQMAIQKRIKSLSKLKKGRTNLTGAARIKIGRLQGAQKFIRDELGRRIGTPLQASDDAQAYVDHQASTLSDRLTIAGVDADSPEGIRETRAEDVDALGRLTKAQAGNYAALTRARKTKDPALIKAAEDELQENNDRMQSLKAAIITLDKTVSTQAADELEARKANTAAIADLAAQMKTANEYANAVQSITTAAATRALADIFSGQLGPRLSVQSQSAGSADVQSRI